jgi:hypothetical protein
VPYATNFVFFPAGTIGNKRNIHTTIQNHLSPLQPLLSQYMLIEISQLKVEVTSEQNLQIGWLKLTRWGYFF